MKHTFAKDRFAVPLRVAMVAGILGWLPVVQAAPDALAQFRPVERWQAVAEVKAVPDAREVTISGEGDILVNGLTFDRSIPYLFTVEEYGDAHIELEFMLPKGSNSGIYVMGRYEIQIFDSHGRERVGAGDLGGLYSRHNAELKRSYEGVRPLVNAAKAPGEWQTMGIFFRAPKFDEAGKKISNATFEKVFINGQLVQRNASTSGPTTSSPLTDEAPKGPVAIQGDHGPVAIRNFRVRPIAESVDAVRIGELDAYWAMVSKAVGSGDFETYRNSIHPDGVLISGRRQSSEPLANALVRWANNFQDTREGLVPADATFRWEKRYGDSTTAYESGIFRFVTKPAGGEESIEFIDFEAILVKQGDAWKLISEYQIGATTEAAWDSLK